MKLIIKCQLIIEFLISFLLIAIWSFTNPINFGYYDVLIPMLFSFNG